MDVARVVGVGGRVVAGVGLRIVGEGCEGWGVG